MTGTSGLSAVKEDGDVDYLVAKTAVEMNNHNIVVVSADTDVLILLLHHASLSSTKSIFSG